MNVRRKVQNRCSCFAFDQKKRGRKDVCLAPTVSDGWLSWGESGVQLSLLYLYECDSRSHFPSRHQEKFVSNGTARESENGKNETLAYGNRNGKGVGGRLGITRVGLTDTEFATVALRQG